MAPRRHCYFLRDTPSRMTATARTQMGVGSGMCKGRGSKTPCTRAFQAYICLGRTRFPLAGLGGVNFVRAAGALPLMYAGALSSINRKPFTVTPDSSELMTYRVCCWGVFTPETPMGQFEKGG